MACFIGWDNGPEVRADSSVATDPVEIIELIPIATIPDVPIMELAPIAT